VLIKTKEITMIEKNTKLNDLNNKLDKLARGLYEIAQNTEVASSNISDECTMGFGTKVKDNVKMQSEKANELRVVLGELKNIIEF
tara:strand:+ start:459 stop:713 length:255 start_codon:yes stop_codon:yes gene_type:complete